MINQTKNKRKTQNATQLCKRELLSNTSHSVYRPLLSNARSLAKLDPLARPTLPTRPRPALSFFCWVFCYGWWCVLSHQHYWSLTGSTFSSSSSPDPSPPCGLYCGDVGEYAGDRTSLWPPGEYWGAAKARREGTSQLKGERELELVLSEEGLQVGE